MCLDEEQKHLPWGLFLILLPQCHLESPLLSSEVKSIVTVILESRPCQQDLLKPLALLTQHQIVKLEHGFITHLYGWSLFEFSVSWLCGTSLDLQPCCPYLPACMAKRPSTYTEWPFWGPFWTWRWWLLKWYHLPESEWNWMLKAKYEGIREIDMWVLDDMCICSVYACMYA